MINVLFENSRMMEEPYRLSQLRLMDELRARLLQSSNIPFSEVHKLIYIYFKSLYRDY